MSKTRLWVIGVIAAVLVVVVAGYVLGISPVLTQASAANVQTSTIQAENERSQTQLASLRVQFANIGTLKKKLNTLRLSIPEAQTASVYIDEITALGAANGVTLQTITIASATLYTAPVVAAPAATSTTATSTATPSPTATPATPVVPTTTTSGLVLVPVTISVDGTLAADQAFVKALEIGERLFVSSALTLTQDPNGGTFVASITGNIFTLQGTSDVVTKQKLVPTPTPTATATPTPTPTPTATTTTSGTKSKSSGSTGTSGGTSTTPVTPVAPSTPDPGTSTPADPGTPDPAST